MTDATIAAQRSMNLAQELTDYFVSRIDAIPVDPEPCEHIYILDFFSAEFYSEMIAQLPEDKYFREMRHVDALRRDGTSTRLYLDLYPEQMWFLPKRQRAFWSTLTKAMKAKEVQEAFKRKFEKQLEKRFAEKTASMNYNPILTLMRDLGGYRIKPHCDALGKTITTQFYLPKDKSQEHLGTIFHSRGDDGPDDRKKRMRFLPASGYAFPVQKNKSWHSVDATKHSDGVRNSLMMVYHVRYYRKFKLNLRVRDRVKGIMDVAKRTKRS